MRHWRTRYIREHGKELIRPHCFLVHSCDQNEREEKVKPIGQEGRIGKVGLTFDLPVRCTRRHLTSRSKRSLSLSMAQWILFLCSGSLNCFIFLRANLTSIWGSVEIEGKQRVSRRWLMEMEGGRCKSITAFSPLLPGAQCRCGGPSPRRHSMVWHALHFSPLTVSSWTSSHANTWATGGFSYLVVGQEYLIIFKKTVRHIIPC